MENNYSPVNDEAALLTLSDSAASKKNEKSFRCNECDYCAADNSTLSKHKLRHTGDKPFSCDKCEYRTRQKGTLNRHKLKHGYDKELFCDKCDYVTKHSGLYNRHLLKHKAEKELLCKKCEYKTPSFKYMKNHKQQHSTAADVQAPNISSKEVKKITEEQASKKDDVKNDDHCGLKDIRSNKQTHNDEAAYHCDQCDYLAATSSSLMTHKRHHAIKPFYCDHCNFSSVKLSKLNQHKLQHTEEKLFNCNQCDYKTARKDHLRAHQQQHTGEKTFFCEHCNYSAIYISNLKQHMLTHTGEKPYKCKLCDYGTTRKVFLRAHELRHAGEKPFHCDECDYKTVTKQYLKTHKLIHLRKNALKQEGKSSEMNFNNNYNKRQSFGLENPNDCSWSTASLDYYRRLMEGKRPTKRLFCLRCSYSTMILHDFESHVLNHFKSLKDLNKNESTSNANSGNQKSIYLRTDLDSCTPFLNSFKKLVDEIDKD